MPPSKDADYRSASQILSSALSQLNTTTISIGDLVAELAHRSFGGVIILLSIIGLLPGISVIAGATIFILAIQMMLGYPTPRLPNYIIHKELNVARLKIVMTKPLHYIGKLESIVKPRFTILTTKKAVRWIGIVIALLAIVMITPLPLSNLLPAIVLLLISLGLLENDGFMVLLGLTTSVFAMMIGLAVINFFYEAALKFV